MIQVGVVGLGLMGHGILQTAAQQGFQVRSSMWPIWISRGGDPISLYSVLWFILRGDRLWAWTQMTLPCPVVLGTSIKALPTSPRAPSRSPR